MILKICCTYKMSILDLSRALMVLGWDHVINSAHNRRASSHKRGAMRIKIGSGPTKVFIADGLRSIQERKGVIIVVDSKAALSRTNLPSLDHRTTGNPLLGLPSLERTDVVIRKPKVMEYVNAAVKPSFLTDLQTSLYRISNHGVRKEAQTNVIKFFNSKLSLRALSLSLSNSFALEPLKDHMKRPEVERLRTAVTLFRQGKDIKEIEKETKCSSFDILYLVRSFDKSNVKPPVKEIKP